MQTTKNNNKNVIVFIIDTAPSMGIKDCAINSQLSSPCITRLDCAKACVEMFLRKLESSRHQSPQLLLITTSKNGAHVNVGWGSSVDYFESELKMLKICDCSFVPAYSSLNSALSTSFQLLSHQRLSCGVDNLGLGRQPWLIKTGSVVLITDGVSYSAKDAKVQLPAIQRRDDYVCNAPFRWDQRLFSIAISASNPPKPLIVMTEATAGKCWNANSLSDLMSLVSTVTDEINNGGVVVRFKSEDKNDTGVLAYLGVKPTNEKHITTVTSSSIPAKDGAGSVKNPCRQAGSLSGYWPIPEESWCDRKSNKIPPRFAHPTLTFIPINEGLEVNDPTLINNPTNPLKKSLSSLVNPPSSSSSLLSSEVDMKLGERFDLYQSFGLPVDWYEIGWMRESHRQSPPFSPTSSSHNQRYAVYLANSGRSEGNGAPIGVLVSVQNHTKKIQQWRCALLPSNFGELTQLFQKASKGLPIDAAVSNYIHHLPSAYYMSLSYALTLATHPPPKNTPKDHTNVIKPLRTNTACKTLLRQLAASMSNGGDAGLSESFRDWQKRQTSHCENDEQRSLSAMNRISASLPKRHALLYAEQQTQLWQQSISGSSSIINPLEPPAMFSQPPTPKLIGIETFDELCSLPISELLPRWVQTSRRLHGGGGFDLLAKVTGMFPANGEPAAVTVHTSQKNKQGHEWTGLDLGGIGLKRYAHVPIHEMSSFYPVLSKLEVVRDASNEVLADLKLARKEELEIVWKEKMSGNFSNPYANSKKSSLTSSSSSSIYEKVGVSLKTGEIVVGGGNESFPSTSSAMFNETMGEMSLLVADTPLYSGNLVTQDDEDEEEVKAKEVVVEETLNINVPSSLKLPPANAHRNKKKKLIHKDAITNITPSTSFTSSSKPPPIPDKITPSPVSVAIPSTSPQSSPLSAPNLEETRSNLKRKEGALNTGDDSKKVQRNESSRSDSSSSSPSSLSSSSQAAIGTPMQAEDYAKLILPAGWILAYSKTNKKYYFFNTQLNVSLWEPPPGTTQRTG